MKILMVHNFYQQSGGEDIVLREEISLLESDGHIVKQYSVSNHDINRMGKLDLLLKTLWNNQVYTHLQKVCDSFKPDIVHFHNTFPIISPSAYYAVKSKGIPVVQTLHNYRLICPNALFFSDGINCEMCRNKIFPWPAVVKSCYRKSKATSTAVACMLALHRLLKTWKRKVDIFITLTEFASTKFIDIGVPANKFFLKPNFIYPDPGIGHSKREFAIFVGRITQEKGILTLIDAWKKLQHKIPLKIVGTGPMASNVEKTIAEVPEIEYLGYRQICEIYDLIGKSSFLIFPSEWYETFGRVAVEAFAKGTPVIASKIGAIKEIVKDKVTGLHFKPGDSSDLAEKVNWAIENPEEMKQMGVYARAEYIKNYTADRNNELLMEIYRLALENAKRSSA